MAEAVRKSTVTWVSLQAAHPLILEICLSPSQAGPWLAGEIAAERVHVRWRMVHPASTTTVELESFWQGSLPAFDFVDCSVTKRVHAPPGTVVGFCQITLFGVEVVREEIEAQRVGAAVPVSRKKRRKKAGGSPREWDYEGIRAVAKEVREEGIDQTRVWFYNRVREVCAGKRPRIKTPDPENNRSMTRIIGDLYRAPKH
jgi:hypothetical protein